MYRTYNFDYDPEMDDLYLYDPKSKTKASIEAGGFIIDLNNKKEISGIEMTNASEILKDIKIENFRISKSLLKNIKKCKVDIVKKEKYFVLKILIIFETNTQISTSAVVPRVTEVSPALAYA